MTGVLVELEYLDGDNLEHLVDLAVTAAEPTEVFPPMPGPPGWNSERIAACRRFYAERFGGLDNTLRTAAYVIRADGQVAGMIRMSRLDQPGTVETGMWLGRPFRGRGVAAAALRALLARAAAAGVDTIVADTTPGNAAALGTLRSLGAALVAETDKIYATIPVHPATA